MGRKKKHHPQDASTHTTSGRDLASSEAPFSQEIFALFGEPIHFRATYHNREWYLCLNDVIVFLTNSADPSQYWRKMRARAKTEAWEETAQEVVALPIPDQHGRLQAMNCANRRTLLRLVQGIPTVDTHFAYLTNKLHTLTFEISIRDHKALKNLPARANLQDNSTPLELLIEATSQAAATEIHRDRNSYGLSQLDVVCTALQVMRYTYEDDAARSFHERKDL